MESSKDSITIKLPHSGKSVEIRNYTTRKDDESSQSALFAGVNVTASSTSKDSQDFELPLANAQASQSVYVKRLVLSIDGDSSNIEDAIDNLRSTDYEALDEAVKEIVDQNSPKAKRELKNSQKATQNS